MPPGYLALDYGEKRIGLAWGKTDQPKGAVPLKAANAPTFSGRLERIRECIQRYQPEALVVGYPYHFQGHRGTATERVDRFVHTLHTHFALPVYRVDETLSSYRAAKLQKSPQRLRFSQRKTKASESPIAQIQQQRATGWLDSQAALLILKDFLAEQTHRSSVQSGAEKPITPSQGDQSS